MVSPLSLHTTTVSSGHGGSWLATSDGEFSSAGQALGSHVATDCVGGQVTSPPTSHESITAGNTHIPQR